MASCGFNGCNIECTGGCSCIEVPDGDDYMCICICDEDVVLPEFETKLQLDTQMNFQAYDFQLVNLAIFLDSNFTGEIHLPAKRAYSCVSLEKEDTSFESVLRELDLTYNDEEAQSS